MFLELVDLDGGKTTGGISRRIIESFNDMRVFRHIFRKILAFLAYYNHCCVAYTGF